MIHSYMEPLPTLSWPISWHAAELLKIAVHAPDPNFEHRTKYMYEFFELLGLGRNRIIFMEEEVR